MQTSEKWLPTLDIGSHINATLQARGIAGARELGSDKARSAQARFLIAPVGPWCCVGGSLASFPLPVPSLTKSPVVSMDDASRTLQVAWASPCPVRALRLPSLGTEGRAGGPL